MPDLANFVLAFSDLEIMAVAFALINLVLLFAGAGKLAIFGAIDSFVYLFAPRLALRFDYLKYYPSVIKGADGKIKKAFKTPRDDYGGEIAPFHERAGDFIIRSPLFSLTFMLLIAPALAKVVGPYFDKTIDLVSPLTGFSWVPSNSKLFRLFIILFFMPFSSIHSTLVSIFMAFIYPAKIIFAFIKALTPPVLFACLFVFLFMVEVTLIYIGFLPLFHQGLMPFVDGGTGLKQFIFWMPIKFRIYIDMVLAPIVVVVPLITTIGSYILSRHEAGKAKEKIDYVVLFYRTGISYFYAPLFAKVFPRLNEEARVVREQRRINEVLVIGMYLESLVCVAGTAYSYVHLAQASRVPISGILLGILVLIVFVPLIVFSSNGFQSFFLDKAIAAVEKIKDLLAPKKGTADA